METVELSFKDIELYDKLNTIINYLITANMRLHCEEIDAEGKQYYRDIIAEYKAECIKLIKQL